MRIKPFALAGAAGAFAIAGSAQATLIGASVVETASGGGQTTYRVYLNYDNPADKQLAVSGNPNVAPVVFTTNTVLINNGGGFAGLKAEDFAGAPITGADDSWVAIGTTMFSGNDTNYSPTFLNNDGIFNVIKGSSWSDTNDGWFDSNPTTPVTGGSIIIAQFTVADKPDGSKGTFRLSGTSDYQPGGSGLVNEFFTTNPVPAPGALALLGVAGLMGARRRRK